MSTATIVFGLTIVSGLAHGLYVVRVGGDYMHARMLLPPLFVLLLPVSVVAARTWQWVAVAAVVVWASASAAVLRTPYSNSQPRSTTSVNAAFDKRHVISDERLVQIRLSLKAHPGHARRLLGLRRMGERGYLGQVARARRATAGSCSTPNSVTEPSSQFIPLRPGVRAPIVVFAGAVGVYTYAAGESVKVVDLFGIVDWLSAHEKLQGRKRPGPRETDPDRVDVRPLRGSRRTDSERPLAARGREPRAGRSRAARSPTSRSGAGLARAEPLLRATSATR